MEPSLLSAIEAAWSTHGWMPFKLKMKGEGIFPGSNVMRGPSVTCSSSGLLSTQDAAELQRRLEAWFACDSSGPGSPSSPEGIPHRVANPSSEARSCPRNAASRRQIPRRQSSIQAVAVTAIVGAQLPFCIPKPKPSRQLTVPGVLVYCSNVPWWPQ